MVRTQIQLTARQADALRRRAAQQGVSMAELVRQSVDALLEEADAGLDAACRRRALDAVGFLGSGAPDLARDHNDAVSEAFRA
jgi:hypothetical protein